MDENQISKHVVEAAIEVHRVLGPGLLESAYKAALTYELTARGLTVERELELPVQYKDVRLDCGFRLDLLVNKLVIVEAKTVDKLHPIHQAQAMTYLRLTSFKLAMLLNFNVMLMRDGIQRVVLNL